MPLFSIDWKHTRTNKMQCRAQTRVCRPRAAQLIPMYQTVPDVSPYIDTQIQWFLGVIICAEVNLCFLVLRPIGSRVLQGSLIMSAPWKLWITPPVHESGGRHREIRSLVWILLFLLSGSQEVVWWWLLLRKKFSWALSLTASSIVGSLLLLCLDSFNLGAILWSSKLLSSCACFPILILVDVLILWVLLPLFRKNIADIIAPKLSIIFHRLIRLGSFLLMQLRFPSVLHPLRGNTTVPYQ